MEYRQKNLKPKPGVDELIKKAVNDQTFMRNIDFFGASRKSAFLNQNEHKIKTNKNCTLTTEGLALYLNDVMHDFLQGLENK